MLFVTPLEERILNTSSVRVMVFKGAHAFSLTCVKPARDKLRKTGIQSGLVESTL